MLNNTSGLGKLGIYVIWWQNVTVPLSQIFKDRDSFDQNSHYFIYRRIRIDPNQNYYAIILGVHGDTSDQLISCYSKFLSVIIKNINWKINLSTHKLINTWDYFIDYLHTILYIIGILFHMILSFSIGLIY